MSRVTIALEAESSADELKSCGDGIHKKKISFLNYRLGEVCIPRVSGTYEVAVWRVLRSLLSMKRGHDNPKQSWFGVHIVLLWQGFDSRRATCV